MAKIKQNNFLDTVDEVFTNAKEAGVLHLHAQGKKLTGRIIEINGKEHFHFGTTGYLGLEQDSRLKEAAINAIRNYGTQFPLSKSYISHPLYGALEEKIQKMYNHPVIITKNSTLGHMAVIPTAVRDEDGVILDHQVHWSVQNATQLLKTRGIPVEMIRHNNLDMLEDKIKELTNKCEKIWYMADGVYSMYGDYAPVAELVALSKKYPQLHLYFDDVHGMSWKGKNGTGFVLDELEGLQENMLLFGTLSKTFGASGAFVVCADKKLFSKIKTFGGPLTFSAQLEPASVAAALASSDIHLSEEIYVLQDELQERINYFNSLLKETDLPLIMKNNSPVFYIGTGMPVSGYKFVNRLMEEGFYVNLGIFPAVPVKNTGIRITISRHNQKEEIKLLVEAMTKHYHQALQETGSDLVRVRKAFRMPVKEEKPVSENLTHFTIQYETSILSINREEWNKLMGLQGTFDWEGQLFLERAYEGGNLPEHKWTFHYFIIRGNDENPVIATFFCDSLWKDDMLAPASTSLKIEEKRKNDKYYLTSKALNMGSLFSEGEHLYIDKSNHHWKEALNLLLREIEELDQKLNTSMIILRDFDEDEYLNKIFHENGYIKVVMPESCMIENISWNSIDDYIASLSKRSRKHFIKEIKPFEDKFEVIVQQSGTEKGISYFYTLYENVKNNNPGLNTFSHPLGVFEEMAADKNWEFIVLYLKEDYDDRAQRFPVGVMFCYKNMNHTYVPSLIGMDYSYSREYNIYRQLLFQTVKRALELSFKKIDFGMTAAFEKKKVGATVIPKYSYVQARDNFSLEMIGLLQNENK